MRVQFTRTSRRHKIGRARALSVMNNNDPRITFAEDGDEQREWTAFDDRGIELEIGGFVVDDGRTLLITHIMPTALRDKGTS